MAWTSDLVVPPGHQMTFKDTLHILSANLGQKLLIPDWAKPLMKSSRDVELAFTELKVCYSTSRPDCARVIHASYLEQKYLLEMVEARRNGDKVEERYDLFSGLLLLDAARDEPDNGGGLSNEELFGWYS